MKKTILFLLIAVTMIITSCYTHHHTVKWTHQRHGNRHLDMGHH
ncbi:MAG: hypothetical protein ACOYVG_08420 [Bacteroidota bacterium]